MARAGANLALKVVLRLERLPFPARPLHPEPISPEARDLGSLQKAPRSSSLQPRLCTDTSHLKLSFPSAGLGFEQALGGGLNVSHFATSERADLGVPCARGQGGWWRKLPGLQRGSGCRC